MPNLTYRLKNLVAASSVLAVVVSTSGCAERAVEESERVAIASYPVKSSSSLTDLSTHSYALSEAYIEAAKRASQGQDIAAVITFLAAAAVARGAVGSASDTALTNAALVGVGSTAIAVRTLSRTTIEGIYTAAKRANCISTAANVGQSLFANQSSKATLDAARAVTFGAIQEVRILVRESLVREVANYSELLTQFGDAIGGATTRAGEERLKRETGLNVVLLNQYVVLLKGCLPNEALSVAEVPTQ